MGLLLSILVACVGVVELLDFYYNVRRSFTLIHRESGPELKNVSQNYPEVIQSKQKGIKDDHSTLKNAQENQQICNGSAKTCSSTPNSIDSPLVTVIKSASGENIELEFKENVIQSRSRSSSPRRFLLTEKQRESKSPSPSPRRFIVEEEPQNIKHSKKPSPIPEYLVSERRSRESSPTRLFIVKDQETKSSVFPLPEQFVVTEGEKIEDQGQNEGAFPSNYQSNFCEGSQNNNDKFKESEQQSSIRKDYNDIDIKVEEMQEIYLNHEEDFHRSPSPYPDLEVTVSKCGINNELLNDSLKEVDEELYKSESSTPLPEKVDTILDRKDFTTTEFRTNKVLVTHPNLPSAANLEKLMDINLSDATNRQDTNYLQQINKPNSIPDDNNNNLDTFVMITQESTSDFLSDRNSIQKNDFSHETKVEDVSHDDRNKSQDLQNDVLHEFKTDDDNSQDAKLELTVSTTDVATNDVFTNKTVTNGDWSEVIELEQDAYNFGKASVNISEKVKESETCEQKSTATRCQEASDEVVESEISQQKSTYHCQDQGFGNESKNENIGDVIPSTSSQNCDSKIQPESTSICNKSTDTENIKESKMDQLKNGVNKVNKNSDEKQASEPFWLIFSGEYTKAMNKDWHGQHFCCWQCDESLTGQRYVLRDDHPYCVSCYESVFANACEKCSRTIGIDSKDLSYKDKHWHEACFLCTSCGESLVDKQFGSKGDRIYCGRCYDEQFASRCDGCHEIFRAGTKKMEYKTRQWHEKCFCCCVCKVPIGTQSFIPREQEIYCAKCYEEKFATRCIKCNKVITSGGVTYKNEPWHRECFTCTNCSKSLAGERFTSRDEKPYCAECFGELFAKRCFACNKPITGIGGTKFISFEDRHWHNDCFFCAHCRTSLVGRGFITDEQDIICPECAKQKLL